MVGVTTKGAWAANNRMSWKSLQGISVGNINGSRDTVVDLKIDGVPTTHTGNGLFSVGPPT
jgi:hypothetical protein